jgi:hypothetical protein
MYEKEIITDVVNFLSQVEGAKVIAFDDFTEDREKAMVVVGIDSTEQVNFALDDFRYDMTILLDVMLDSDKDGVIMDALKDQVLEVLHPIFDDPERYGDIFSDLDRICYFHFNSMTNSISDRSMRTEIKIELIGSFN